MTNKLVMAPRRLAVGAVSLMLVWGLAVAPVRAQDAAAPAQTQTQTQQQLPQGQIQQLVAPIALYPDPLLTQVLMASTYPLEVVEAARWSQANPSVKGTALEDAMQAQSWDPSVKALAAVPQTLEMMSAKLDWTEQLGDAFLAQQQDVLDAVQKLRAEAQAAGNLQSTPHQVVTTAPAPAGVATAGLPQAIEIEPVNPDVYYVPIYNPAVAYGAWSYPDYPPFYWYPPGFVASNVVSFASGVAVGAAIWGGCDWWNHNVIINANRFNAFNRTNINIANNVWVHNPAHRGDVPYRNAAVAERFGRENTQAMRNELRDRLDAVRPNEVRPNDQHPMEAERDLKKDVAPAAPERREADVRRDMGERDLGERNLGERLEQHEALPRPGFDRPRVDEGADLLRRRSIDSFRPRAHDFGGFRGHFGGLRRL
jgi:Protein of unknown function (DUF3300)